MRHAIRSQYQRPDRLTDAAPWIRTAVALVQMRTNGRRRSWTTPESIHLEDQGTTRMNPAVHVARLQDGDIQYNDVGEGPTLVFLHGVLMSGSVWDPVIDLLRDDFRCIVPTLPLGSHRSPMSPTADLTLAGFGRLVNEFLDSIDVQAATLIGNDHGAVLAAAVDGSPRVERLVISSCEAFENYPPGLPGKNLRLIAALPGGLLVATQLLRIRAFRQLPVTMGWLAKRPLPDNVVDQWLEPSRRDRGVRRDLRRYAARARRRDMVSLCQRLSTVRVPCLVIWTPEDRIQRPDHGRRLAGAIPGASLAEIPDSYTLVMRDQPAAFAEKVHGFAATWH